MTYPTLERRERSSQIWALAYDPEPRRLYVQFIGERKPQIRPAETIYEFQDVPAEIGAALLASQSPGSYFAANVKGKFPFFKIKAVP